jgi:hypothetical protein
MKICFRQRFAVPASIILFVIIIQACADHKLPTPDGFGCSSKVVSYAVDVTPIINSSCAIVGDGGCHNGGNGANLDWRVFSNVQQHATQMKDRITRTPGTSGHMPQIGSITDAQIQVISCWVDQGAQNN